MHYVQPAVGHYGVFNGSRFRAEIAPRIADFVLSRHGGRRAMPKVVAAEYVASCPSRTGRTGIATRAQEGPLNRAWTLVLSPALAARRFRGGGGCAGRRIWQYFPYGAAAPLYRRPSEPSAITIAFEREIYLVRVRRHRQARRYTLRIHSATREVLLTMPPRGSLKQAREFAQKHGGWIAARLDRIPEPTPFAHGTLLPLRGVDHRIEHRAGARGTVWIEEDGDQRMLCVAGEAPHVARACAIFSSARPKAIWKPAGGRRQRWHCRQARVDPRSVEPLGFLLDHRRLVLFLAADPGATLVLDYLAAHEVAHLIEMNHSRQFWRVVERICPDLARAKGWLDANGTNLHRYGQQHGTRARR